MRWLLAWCAVAWPAPAEAEPVPVWRVRTDVEILSVPLAVGARLAPELRRPESFAAADAKVQALLLSGEAVLLGWPTVDGLAGERSSAESIVEIRDPAVFDFPVCFPSSSPRPSPTTPTSSLVMPTAFEVRNVGSTLLATAEIERESGRLELELTVKYSRLVGTGPVVGSRLGQPEGRNLARPHFISWEATTALKLRGNGGALLGQLVPPQSPPRVIFFLLHATAKPCPAPLP